MSARMLKKQELAATFRGKCEGDEIAKGDHLRFVFRAGGETYAKTKVSHGRGDVSVRIASRIAKQVGLDRKQLTELVDCTIDTKAFYENLVAKGPLI